MIFQIISNGLRGEGLLGALFKLLIAFGMLICSVYIPIITFLAIASSEGGRQKIRKTEDNTQVPMPPRRDVPEDPKLPNVA